MHTDVDFSVEVGDDSSDDNMLKDVSSTLIPRRTDIDTWMENTLRELTLATDTSNVDLLDDLSYGAPTAPPNSPANYVRSDADAHEHQPVGLDWLTVSSVLPCALQEFLESDAPTLDRENMHILLDIAFPCSFKITTQHGTFVRKPNFRALATVQMLEHMLAQRTSSEVTLT